MRKIVIALLALALCLPGALAEETRFADVAGEYNFASGVGAWSTDLTILPDGSFYGTYHDTDMEDSELNGVHYDAICYICSFTGRIAPPEHSSAQELESSVLALDYEIGEPYVDDGVRYEPVEPYGIAQGDALRFFMQGAYVEAVPEDLVEWLKMKEGWPEWDRLPYVAMFDETAAAGFSGPARREEPLPALTIAPESGGSWILFSEPQATDAPAPEGLTFPVDAEVVNCKQSVSLRSEPSTQGALLAQVPLGELVQVYSNIPYYGSERWFVDAAYNGLRGYICIEYLDVLLPGYLCDQRGYLQGASGTITAVSPGTDLILREGPGAGYGAFGLLFGGETLGYLGDARQDDAGTCWYRASYYGAECWISARYTALTLNDGTVYTGSRGIF